MVATSKNKQILFLRFCNILRDPLISVGTLWKMEKFDLPALISSKQNRGFSARNKFIKQKSRAEFDFTTFKLNSHQKDNSATPDIFTLYGNHS